eukprot:SAG25_NODE_286_length_10355_cov_16.654544_14_plen_77_part_00
MVQWGARLADALTCCVATSYGWGRKAGAGLLGLNQFGLPTRSSSSSSSVDGTPPPPAAAAGEECGPEPEPQSHVTG